jgi:hypothetical protein
MAKAKAITEAKRVAKRTAGKTHASRRKAAREVRQFGDAGGEIVKAAARLLDQEMAVGITAAKAVRQRLQKERRIESADFSDALSRLQADARDVIDALDHQLDGSRLKENTELAKRFVAKTRDLLELLVGVVSTGAELANQLLQVNLPARKTASKRKSRR